MAPSPWPEAAEAHEMELLLDLAQTAIVEALTGHRSAPPDLPVLPTRLRQATGVFVTLHVDGELNGCIGMVEGAEAVAQAVPRLALAAAFEDHRLPHLTRDDLGALVIELSLLSPLRPIPAATWTDLITQLQPRVDGTVIRAGHRQALFLPDVWDQLPDPPDFLHHLYLKAGLTPRSWPPGMSAHRFTTQRRHRSVGAPHHT